ncbi:MAG: hypothetical protein IJE66_08410 [Akkermansia sp.]|nr:hypothetical protein [Akkermansia sp.]
MADPRLARARKQPDKLAFIALYPRMLQLFFYRQTNNSAFFCFRDSSPVLAVKNACGVIPASRLVLLACFAETGKKNAWRHLGEEHPADVVKNALRAWR